MIAPEPRPGRAWFAVLAVALGLFCVVTSELLPAGLLSPVAATLGVSEGRAGLVVTVPGLVATVAAPLIASGTGRMDRRLLLVGLAAVLGLANLGCAVAPNFAVLLAARLAVGLGIGGFWAIAAGLPVRLVSAERVDLATATVFGGASVASVIGVPTATVIGDLGGWRDAFTVLGVLALVATMGLLVALPPLPCREGASFRRLHSAYRHSSGVRVGVLLTLLLVTAQFVVYPFVRPLLRDVSGVAGEWTGPLLLLFGAAGVLGNFIAGSAGTARVRRTLLTISWALGLALAALAALGHTPGIAVSLLAVWGLAYGGVSVALQLWMRLVAPERIEAAAALCVTAYNLGIGLGALLGGLLVDRLSPAAVLWVGSALALICASVVLVKGTPPRAGAGYMTVPRCQGTNSSSP